MTSELIWQHLEAPGWEHVRVISDHPGWTVFDSILVREDSGQVLRGGYTLVVDKQWRTLELRFMLESAPGSMQGVHLISEGDGRWSDANEQHIPELDGILDVDIQWSPLTNTLPLRRLNMTEGSHHDVRLAYIALPDLALQVVDQHYHRPNASTLEFSAPGSPEKYLIKTDQDGYVSDYPELFTRTWPR